MQMRGRVSRISSAVKTTAVSPAAGSVTMTMIAGTTRTRTSVVGFHRPLMCVSEHQAHIQRHASCYSRNRTHFSGRRYEISKFTLAQKPDRCHSHWFVHEHIVTEQGGFFHSCMFPFRPVIYVCTSCFYSSFHTATLMWVRGRFPFSNVLQSWNISFSGCLLMTGRLECFTKC